MEEDSDTRSSFPSPFKQDVANGSAGASNTDTLSFRKCLDRETNVPFLQTVSFCCDWHYLYVILRLDGTSSLTQFT